MDRPLTAQWRVRRQTLAFYEIDTDAIAPFVHPGLELTELRPGVSILSVECLHYAAGHFRPDHPESYEMVVAAMVAPDLSIDMPVPKFALQILNVVTDSVDFVEHEKRLMGSPMNYVPGLRMEFSPDGASVNVLDGDRPIVTSRNVDPPTSYEHKTLWGLTFSATRGLERGVFRWEGLVHEHMKRGEWGQLHAHPAFGGIDVSRVRSCYRQLAAKPDCGIDIRYFHLGVKIR